MDVIDEIAGKVIKGAEIAVARDVPRPIVAEAFYRAGLAVLIDEFGLEVAIATLRDSADKLSAPDVKASVVN